MRTFKPSDKDTIKFLLKIIAVLIVNQKKPSLAKRSSAGWYFSREKRREVIKDYILGMTSREVSLKHGIGNAVPGNWAKQEGFLPRKSGNPNSKANRHIDIHNKLRLRKLGW